MCVNDSADGGKLVIGNRASSSKVAKNVHRNYEWIASITG